MSAGSSRQNRMPTLGKLISQPMQDEAPPVLTFQQRVDRWMINEGISNTQRVLTDRKSKNVIHV